MKEKPTESRGGVKGGSPLRGQGAELPCGVWGNAPTVPRQTYSKEEVKQSRGSEASRAQTSRVLRRAPKRLYPPSMLCRARWARPRCWACDHSCSFPASRGFHARDRRSCALWGAKSVLLMQPLAVLRRKERQLDVFDALLHPMRLAKQGNMM